MGVHPASLEAILKRLNLWEDCIFCMDAGDERCYPGHGQHVYDLSRSQLILTRGSTDAATAADPSYVGQAGSFKRGTSVTDFTNPAHFSMDGGDYLHMASAPQQAPWRHLGQHGGELSVLTLWATPTSGSLEMLWVLGDTAANTSFQLNKSATNGGRYEYWPDADPMGPGYAASLGTITTNTWHCALLSHHEDGGVVSWARQIAGTFTAAFNALHGLVGEATLIPQNLTLGGDFDGPSTFNPAPATTRFMMFALWNKAIAQSDADSIIRELNAWRLAGLP